MGVKESVMGGGVAPKGPPSIYIACGSSYVGFYLLPAIGSLSMCYVNAISSSIKISTSLFSLSHCFCFSFSFVSQIVLFSFSLFCYSFTTARRVGGHPAPWTTKGREQPVRTAAAAAAAAANGGPPASRLGQAPACSHTPRPEEPSGRCRWWEEEEEEGSPRLGCRGLGRGSRAAWGERWRGGTGWTSGGGC